MKNACICLIIYTLILNNQVFLQTASPSGESLLRGVYQTRSQLSGSATIESRITRRNKLLRDPSVSQINFAKGRWRFRSEHKTVVSKPDQIEARDRLIQEHKGDVQSAIAAGLGKWRPFQRVSVYDGSKLIEYESLGSCYIRKPSANDLYDCFDIRALGISQYQVCILDLDYMLSEDIIRTARNLGKENVNGKALWRVRCHNQNAEWDYWMSDATGFQVHQSSMGVVSGPGAKGVLVRSTYEKETDVLPRQVVIQYFDTSPMTIHEYNIKAISYSDRADDAAFTYQGLDMPVGTMVQDDRTNRLAGYFDGKEISENYKTAMIRGRELIAEQVNPSKPMWPFYLVLTVVGLVLAVLGYRKFARK